MAIGVGDQIRDAGAISETVHHAREILTQTHSFREKHSLSYVRSIAKASSLKS